MRCGARRHCESKQTGQPALCSCWTLTQRRSAWLPSTLTWAGWARWASWLAFLLLAAWCAAPHRWPPCLPRALAHCPAVPTLPPPAPASQVGCAAALNTLTLLAGLLLPAYLALRRHHAAALEQAATLALAQQQAAPDLAGAAGYASDAESVSSSAGGPSSPAAARRRKPARTAAAAAAPGRCAWPGMDAAAAWVLDSVFLYGAPLEFQAAAWAVLGVGAWMAGTLLALPLAPAT